MSNLIKKLRSNVNKSFREGKISEESFRIFRSELRKYIPKE